METTTKEHYKYWTIIVLLLISISFQILIFKKTAYNNVAYSIDSLKSKLHQIDSINHRIGFIHQRNDSLGKVYNKYYYDYITNISDHAILSDSAILHIAKQDLSDIDSLYKAGYFNRH